MPLLEEAKPLELATTHKSYLFYGPGGSGKTTLALSHPGKRKFLLDIDEKAAEMENLTSKEREGVVVWKPNEPLGAQRLQLITIDPKRKDPYTKGTLIAERPRGYQKIVDITNELLALGYKSKRGECEFPYDVVILDSLTRFSDHMLYLLLYEHKMSSFNQSMYDAIKRNYKEYLGGFLNLPCDRIICAHEYYQEKRDKDTDALLESKTRPNATGSIREELVSYFTEAYYFLGMDLATKKWKVQTYTDRDTVARTSKKLDPEQIIDPKIIYG